MKNFTFTSRDGKKVKYSDVISGKFSVNNREDELIIAKAGGFGWEYSCYSETHQGVKGRTPTTDYLIDQKKVDGSNAAFDVYEQKCGKLNKNSKVIEFGCNLARNVRIAYNRYSCEAYGIDVCKEVIDEDNKFNSVDKRP